MATEKGSSSTSPSASVSPSSLEILPPDPRKQPLEGGFEVEFVDSPKELQTECPVCLQVLCEPYQATCCGYSYCKSCIQRLKNNGHRCPTCNESEYDVFPDKRLQRSLYGFRVRCSHESEGCKWVGELGELDRHLNANPRPESHLSGCDFVKVKCITCGDFFDRKILGEHEISLCPMRLYSCEYCHSYESNCHDVTVNHWPVCPCRPVPCPNECGVYPEKQHLAHHLSKECPHEKVSCPFAYTGCSVKLPANEMEEHVRENFYQHASDMAAHERQLAQLMADVKSTLDEEKREIREQFQEQLQCVQLEVDRLKVRQENDRKSIEALQSHAAIVPIVFTLDDIEKRLKRKDMGWSPRPFYTHPQGYKLLLCVDVYGNGTGKGTHMSIFLSLLKGEFDEHLKWPFRAAVTVQLQNQEDDNDHHKEIIKYHENTPNATAGRVMEEGRQGRPWGKGKFIAHSDLVPKYLKDDCIRVCIASVDLCAVSN